MTIPRLPLLLAAAILATAALWLAAPARADEVCLGSECDTVAFVDSEASFTLYLDLVPNTEVGRFYFGNPGDEPLMGDWDCDGEQTPAMYRRSQGYM